MCKIKLKLMQILFEFSDFYENLFVRKIECKFNLFYTLINTPPSSYVPNKTFKKMACSSIACDDLSEINVSNFNHLFQVSNIFFK